MATIDNLSIEISASADGAVNSLNRLNSAIRPLGGSAKNAAEGLKYLESDTIKVEQGTQSATKSVDELSKVAERMKKTLYNPAKAAIFAALKSDADVLKMKLDSALLKLSDLLNADEPDNGAIANATANVRRLTDAYAKAKSKADEAGKSSKGAGKDMESAGESAKKGSGGIASFWGALKRIAFYRFVRSILREIAEAFKVGITNLYKWSSAVNGGFARSMNTLATATNYLTNSLGAMTAPLIDALAPAIDFVIDKVVDLLNVFNQFFAVLSGSSTYTVAKKVATSWGDAGKSVAGSASSAAKDIKRTLLGFDEINQLTKPGSSGGGGGGGGGSFGTGSGIQFEEKPLEGFFKDLYELTEGWPDWLKWLLGIGTVAIGAWGISKLPSLIGLIWDALKNLFTTKIPDWFKWLFGPKDDDLGVDIPDHIDLPDVDDIPINLTKGDWSVLDELKDKNVACDLTVSVKKAPTWDDEAWNAANIGGKNVARFVDVSVKKALTWDTDAWEAANMGGSTVSRLIDVVVRKALTWNDIAWDAANMGGSTISRFIDVVVRKAATWNAEAWSASNMGGKTVVRFVDVAVRKAKTWNDNAWSAANMGGKNVVRFVDVAVRKANTWNNEAYKAANMGGSTVSRLINVAVVKAKTWNAEAYKAANMGGNTVARIINVAVQKAKTWSDEAYKAANMGGSTVSRIVNVATQKAKTWNVDAWQAAKMVTSIVTRTIKVALKKDSAWDKEAWKAATMTSAKITVTITLKKKNFKNIADFIIGDVKGGGGTTDGGGAGRGRNALGGAFFQGKWHEIPQYAGGTTNAHGSLFLAGEAGPEVVGHVGGRTEVLNKSQLAAAMYSAVHSAMQGVTLDANFYNADGEMNGDGMAEMLEYMRQDNDEMRRQNDLLREQNQLLAQINEKEFGISTGQINRANAYANRRAGVTVASVMG